MSQNTSSRYVPGWMIALVVLALIGIVTLFVTQRQSAANETAALEAQALAEQREATAVAAVAESNNAQATVIAQAEAVQSTAAAEVEAANAALAQAETFQTTAVAEAESANTALAEAEALQSTAAVAQVQAELGQATAIAAVNDLVTQQADAQATQVAQGEVIAANATAQTDLELALAVASTQAAFEANRANGLATTVSELGAVPPHTVDGNAGDTTALELTETYTADDGSISFQYPAGWVAEGLPGTVTLGSSAEALSDTATEPIAGHFRAQIIALPVSLMSSITAESTAAEVLSVFLQSLPTEDMPIFGEVTELTIGRYPAARVEGSNATIQVVLYAVNLGEGTYALVVGGSALGELANFDATLQAIIGTLTATVLSS